MEFNEAELSKEFLEEQKARFVEESEILKAACDAIAAKYGHNIQTAPREVLESINKTVLHVSNLLALKDIAAELRGLRADIQCLGTCRDEE